MASAFSDQSDEVLCTDFDRDRGVRCSTHDDHNASSLAGRHCSDLQNAELAVELWVIWGIATLSAPMNKHIMLHMEFVQNMTALQATSRFAHKVSDGSRSLSNPQAIGASGGNLNRHCIGVCIRIYHSGEILRHPLQWVPMTEASYVHY